MIEPTITQEGRTWYCAGAGITRGGKNAKQARQRWDFAMAKAQFGKPAKRDRKTLRVAADPGVAAAATYDESMVRKISGTIQLKTLELSVQSPVWASNAARAKADEPRLASLQSVVTHWRKSL